MYLIGYISRNDQGSPGPCVRPMVREAQGQACQGLVRIRRLSLGNPGDVRPVGGGVSELRIHYGPGYRVYFVQPGSTVILLLPGGDKSTQERDISIARNLARGLEEETP